MGDMKHEIAALLAGIDSLAEMRLFLAEIFTDAEYADIALRWRLMKMLSAGVTQREISAALKISLCKITRGAKILKRPNSISTNLLNRTVDIKRNRQSNIQNI
jgi:TrpR family trp operon transcriptional repressor